MGNSQSLQQVTPVMDHPSALSRDLTQSLAALAGSAIGDLYHAAERGVFVDFVGAYSRLLKLFSRPMSDMVAHRDVIRWGEPRPDHLRGLMVPDRAVRLDFVQASFGPLFRNLSALDAERHWRKADGVIKGLCDREALALAFRADRKGQESDDLDGDEQIQMLVLSVELDAMATKYRRLADGLDWTAR